MIFGYLCLFLVALLCLHMFGICESLFGCLKGLSRYCCISPLSLVSLRYDLILIGSFFGSLLLRLIVFERSVEILDFRGFLGWFFVSGIRRGGWLDGHWMVFSISCIDYCLIVFVIHEIVYIAIIIFNYITTIAIIMFNYITIIVTINYY